MIQTYFSLYVMCYVLIFFHLRGQPLCNAIVIVCIFTETYNRTNGDILSCYVSKQSAEIND